MTDIARDTVLLRLNETTSTLDALRRYSGEEGPKFTVCVADYQTAGRGQGSNSWESEAGQNLLMAIRLRPHGLEARRQFALSEAIALAVRDTLARLADGFTVKWPNDVYWRDMKVSGTLAQCDIHGPTIACCMLGTGINVNQQSFRSDAPNPVSLRHIIGHATDRDTLLWATLEALSQRLDAINDRQFDRLHAEYLSKLYRRHGLHAYEDHSGRFLATLQTVTPEGLLVLQRTDGTTRQYAFKEVKHVVER